MEFRFQFPTHKIQVCKLSSLVMLQGQEQGNTLTVSQTFLMSNNQDRMQPFATGCVKYANDQEACCIGNKHITLKKLPVQIRPGKPTEVGHYGLLHIMHEIFS